MKVEKIVFCICAVRKAMVTIVEEAISIGLVSL